MKKVLTLAAAAFLMTGIAMAHEGDKKKCGTGKDCCKKECSKDKGTKEKKEVKKDVKPAAYKKG